MERKSIFLIDLSSLIKNNAFKKGILSSYHVNNIADILNVFKKEIVLTLDKIIFLSDKKFESDLNTFYILNSPIDKELWEKYRTLLTDFEIIIYPDSKKATVVKDLKEHRILSVVSYAHVWYREIQKSLPEMELYDYIRISHPRSVISWNIYVNYEEPEMKLLNKQNFYNIEEELNKIFSDNDPLSPYDEKIPGYHEVELIETAEGDLIEGKIISDGDDVDYGMNTSQPNQLMKDIKELYLNEFTDLLDPKTKKIINDIKSHKSRAVFLYGKDTFLKQKTAEYILHIKKIRKFEYDLLDGFPDFTDEIKNCQIFYFKNLHALSPQRQMFLWNAITDFSLEAKPIIFEGGILENIAFGLREKITPVHIETGAKYEDIITKIFLALVFRKMVHYEREESQIDMLKIIKENNFRSLLSRIHDISTIDIILKRNNFFSEADHLFEPTQWYFFLTEAELYESYPPKTVSKKLGYYMKYVGDYWEISFNYNQPLLVEKRLGLHYIAYMMMHAGKDLSATELRKKIQQNGKVPPVDAEKNVPAVRKSISDTIEHIAELEDKFGLQNGLSYFLTETFFPNKLLNSEKDRKLKENYFRDALDQCKCNFPENMDFKWELISTPLYNEGK